MFDHMLQKYLKMC